MHANNYTHFLTFCVQCTYNSLRACATSLCGRALLVSDMRVLAVYLSLRVLVHNQGKWNDIEVYVKRIDKDTVSMSTVLRLEVKAMRDIQHPNLVNFVGACCDSPHLCILMQVAPKGSLDDILAIGYLELDWNFKYSLLKVYMYSKYTAIIIVT